ncbi:membrane protein insertase YidC [Candidatus Desantisbacteria bacterium]|nr:membrane protein insertase YidC [Candidatus Desantisbacteria bacterium]
MEKRMLLAIVLSVAIMVIWTYLFQPQNQPGPVKNQKIGTSMPVSPIAERFNENNEKGMLTAENMDTSFLINEIEKKEVILENQLIKIIFTNLGGIIKQVSLKKYNDNKNENIKLIDLNEKNNFYPLGIYLNEAALDKELNFKLWDVEIKKEDHKSIINFSYTINKTQNTNLPYLKFIKEFTLEDNSYLVSIKIKIINLDNSEHLVADHKLLWEPLLNDTEIGISENSIVTCIANKVKHHTIHKIEKSESFPIDNVDISKNNNNWISIANKYFVCVFLPGEDTKSLFIDKTNKDEKNLCNIGLVMKSKTLSPGAEIEEKTEIYIGPKEYEKLSTLGKSLEENINFGFFGFMSKGLLIVLRYLFSLVHNYGMGIIIITIIIKIIFMPLTEKSHISMKKMQGIQGEVEILKQKYKSDAQRLNAEIMKLYKDKKVNPFGGCLPMLVQIPIFLAFYNTLNNAIELRHAPFIWWITDLSKPDTITHIGSIAINILPIFMLVSMVFQQKMTAHNNPKSTKDEKLQQNFLLFGLPVIFGVMFYKMPSGLVLYWFLNNVLTIIHQYFINKKIALQS